jgi:flagellar basal-body rod protein FlgB
LGVFPHIHCGTWFAQETPEVISMTPIISDNITGLLQTFLDVNSKRAEVIAGNIANADTPGYVAKKLEFEGFLQDAARQATLPGSQQEPLSTAGLSVVEQQSEMVGLDGNTVDLGKEMAEMASAGGAFNFGAKMLQSRLRLLRTAIREGK